jgi:hypothetical protein
MVEERPAILAQVSGKVDYCDAGNELEAMELRELPPKPV